MAIEVTYNLPGFVNQVGVVYDGNDTLTQIAPNRIVFPDLTTQVIFVASINNADLNILLSALLSGATMQSPDDAERVYENVVEWFEMPIDLCALVTDCITNDEATRNAIADLIADAGGAGSSNGTQTVVGTDSALYSEENILTGSACDNNTVMGEAIEIVKALNTIAEDWLQSLSGVSLPAELALLTIESIPLLGHLTSNDLGIALDWLTDEVLSQYEASYDDVLRNEAACLLYDASCADCALSLDEMLEVFASKVAIGINPSKNWAELIDDLTSLTLGNQLVYGLWVVILATWKAGNLFRGLNKTAVLTYAAQTATPTNPAIIGCDPCASPCEFDFTLGSYGNTWYSDASNPPSSVYTQSVGWETVNRLPSVAEETNRIETTAVTALLACGDTMRVTYDVIQASDRSDDNLRVRCGALNSSSPKLTVGNNQTYDFNISTADGSDLDVRCGNANPNTDTPSQTIIRKIEILP